MKAEQHNMLESFLVGRSRIRVFYLQFTIDTTFFSQELEQKIYKTLILFCWSLGTFQVLRLI